jgi:hypothetical protein
MLVDPSGHWYCAVSADAARGVQYRIHDAPEKVCSAVLMYPSTPTCGVSYVPSKVRRSQKLSLIHSAEGRFAARSTTSFPKYCLFYGRYASASCISHFTCAEICGPGPLMHDIDIRLASVPGARGRPGKRCACVGHQRVKGVGGVRAAVGVCVVRGWDTPPYPNARCIIDFVLVALWMLTCRCCQRLSSWILRLKDATHIIIH